MRDTEGVGARHLSLSQAWTIGILAHLCWGFLGPGGKLLLEAWEPWSLNAARMVVATVVVMVFYGREETTYGLKALMVDKHLMALGIIGVGVTFALYIASLQYIEATAAGVLIFLAPYMTAILATVFLREPIGWHLMFAAAVALVGAYLALFGLSADALVLLAPDTRFGLLVGLASVLMWAIYTVHLKVVAARYPIGRLTVAMFTAASIFFLLNAIVMERHAFDAAAVTRPDMLVYLGLHIVFPTTAAYLLYTKAVDRLGAAPTTLLLGVELLATAVLAHLLLNERFPPVRILGLVVTTAAVAYFVWAQTRFEQRRASNPAAAP